MKKRNQVKIELKELPYTTTDSWVNPDGFTISAGDMIKIKGKNSFGVGEWGSTFKVKQFCTHKVTGVEWVDCFEMFRGSVGPMRSFPLERIKRIPTKRKRKARVIN